MRVLGFKWHFPHQQKSVKTERFFNKYLPKRKYKAFLCLSVNLTLTHIITGPNSFHTAWLTQTSKELKTPLFEKTRVFSPQQQVLSTIKFPRFS